MSTGCDPMKWCTQCQCIKIRADFHFVSVAKGRRKYVCQLCYDKHLERKKAK
jgi:hypothetical protein